MIWALRNDIKVSATLDSIGYCPYCKKKVFPRCGEVMVWHWAHYKGQSCLFSSESDSEWSAHYKNTFGKENAEIIIEKYNKSDIADILTKQKVVIKLVNHLISKDKILKKESFFGNRFIWLLNGEKFQNNISFSLYHYYGYYMSILDLQELLLTNEITSDDLSKMDIFFEWKYAQRKWRESNRNIFIDFGFDYLFWVKSGMGTFEGMGKFISKKRFLNKYGGNFNYYSTNKNART